MTDFFSLFEIPVSFDVDLADLEKRYFAIQRACHPDRFVGKMAAERQQAIMRSMQANEAYEVLKTPLLRARHILALQGIHVGSEKDSVKPSPELLVHIMELREALADAETAETVSRLRINNEADIQGTLAALSSAFARHDFAAAAQEAIKLGYLVKIEDEARLKMVAVNA